MSIFVISASAQITGGYNDADKTDKTVIDAAKFAVKAENKRSKTAMKFVSVEKAEQQVVAGMNYHIWLRYTSRGTQGCASAVVFRSLKGTYSLTTWESSSCDDASSTAASYNASLTPFLIKTALPFVS